MKLGKKTEKYQLLNMERSWTLRASLIKEAISLTFTLNNVNFQ